VGGSFQGLASAPHRAISGATGTPGGHDIAIALGVAMGTAVFLVNAAALNEFGLATKRLVGEADVVVRAACRFSGVVISRTCREPGVSVASPVLELEVALPGRREPLKVLGVDAFTAATLQTRAARRYRGWSNRSVQGGRRLFEQQCCTTIAASQRRFVAHHVGSTPKFLHVSECSRKTAIPRRSG